MKACAMLFESAEREAPFGAVLQQHFRIMARSKTDIPGVPAIFGSAICYSLLDPWQRGRVGVRDNRNVSRHLRRASSSVPWKRFF